MQKAYLNAEGGNVHECRQMTILRIGNAIYFANAEYTADQLLEKVSTQPWSPQYVLLDFKAVGFIDITGVNELKRLREELAAKNIKIIIVSLLQPVREVFASSGFLREIGEAAIHPSYHSAIESVRANLHHHSCAESCPGSNWCQGIF